jgi:type IV pilus assembly protein PilQ
MRAKTTLLLALLLGGCSTTTPDPKPVVARADPSSDVRAAESIFKENRYTEAIVACIEIARRDPLTPGLADLQARIMSRLAQLRQENIKAQTAATAAGAAADAARHGILPDTYRLTRHVVGETAPFKTPANKMQEMLRKPVSVHLENVVLTDIVTQIGSSQNINIIVDSGVGGGKTITIHAENTPLEEILEYVGRNMNVTFSVGQNIIWATAGNDKQGTVPLETRVYRLRQGLPGNEVPGGAALGEQAQAGSGEINIVASIKKFVPQPAGADLSFDTRAHALLVRNTRENLGLTEIIINALDIRPQQILIEARFISTQASDMRELGIDWLIAGADSVASVNKTAISENIPKTGIDTPVGPVTLSGDHLGAGQLDGGSGSFMYQGVLDHIRMRAVLSALEKSEQARTLTVPRITTVNNRTATIHIGEDFQYYDNLTVSTTTQYYNNSGPANVNSNNAPVFSGTPKTIKLGYKLAVTPSIGADQATINLALIPDITELQNKTQWAQANDPTSSTVQTPGKLPIVLQKKIETEVVVRSGETVVMGGLAQASGGKSRSGLPWLANLPFLGQLFRTDSVNEGTDNLLIFVTATVLSDIGEELVPLRATEKAAQAEGK